jgi:hypothetical protein
MQFWFVRHVPKYLKLQQDSNKCSSTAKDFMRHKRRLFWTLTIVASFFSDTMFRQLDLFPSSHVHKRRNTGTSHILAPRTVTNTNKTETNNKTSVHCLLTCILRLKPITSRVQDWIYYISRTSGANILIIFLSYIFPPLFSTSLIPLSNILSLFVFFIIRYSD